MASSQKRLVTAPSSKLGKSDIVAVLRRDDAWALLPQEAREQLYALLPKPSDGDGAHDPDVHPLNTKYKAYIEAELRRFRDDLKDGREQKKWREEAMQAGRDRAEGKFDEWKEMQREEYWGKPEVENVKVNGEQDEEIDDGKAVNGLNEIGDSEATE